MLANSPKASLAAGPFQLRAGGYQGCGASKGAVGSLMQKPGEAGQTVVVRFELKHPNAFSGDTASLLQCVYRYLDLPLMLRMDGCGGGEGET